MTSMMSLLDGDDMMFDECGGRLFGMSLWVFMSLAGFHRP